MLLRFEQKWAMGDGLVRPRMHWPIPERSRVAQCGALEKVSCAVGFACILNFHEARIARSTRAFWRVEEERDRGLGLGLGYGLISAVESKYRWT